MNTSKQLYGVAKGTSILARAKFGPGMLLQHEDLEQLNIYTRELNRLMFRSMFGCGVVCGLVVSTDTVGDKVNVSVDKGLALDCQGDPIYVPTPQHLCIDTQCDGKPLPELWVVLCRTQKCCAPRTTTCSTDDDESGSVCTRELDGFEIRVVGERPKGSCGCEQPDPKKPSPSIGVEKAECWCANPEHSCYADHYLGKCECDDCGSCDCDCVLLAYLTPVRKNPQQPQWQVDHRVRRFVRPMLMRDPQVWKEEQERNKAAQGAQGVQQQKTKSSKKSAATPPVSVNPASGSS